MSEQELERLLARLTADLREELPPETRLKVLLFVTAAELWAERQQSVEAGELRGDVARMCLECFGTSDLAIDKTRDRLLTGREQPSLNWRN